MKMAQYKRGKVFCDAVADEAGIRALNDVWRDPEALPSTGELDDPDAWIERTGAAKGRLRTLLHL